MDAAMQRGSDPIYISLTLTIFSDRNLCSKLKWLEFSWQVHGNATIWIPQASITGIMSSSIIHTYFLYKLLDKCRKNNNRCTLKTSQTKLHCPGWIWPLHRCKVEHALENASNLMTWWTWRIEICASLMPLIISLQGITNFTWKTLTILLTESQQHTFHIGRYKRFIASKAMRWKFFSISPHPFEQMPPKWTHTQALWKQNN